MREPKPKSKTERKPNPNQIKSNQIKSNQIKSNQIKSNQIKSNQIKSNKKPPNSTLTLPHPANQSPPALKSSYDPRPGLKLLDTVPSKSASSEPSSATRAEKLFVAVRSLPPAFGSGPDSAKSNAPEMCDSDVGRSLRDGSWFSVVGATKLTKGVGG